MIEWDGKHEGKTKNENFKKEVCIKVMNPEGGKNMGEKKEGMSRLRKKIVGMAIASMMVISMVLVIIPEGGADKPGDFSITSPSDGDEVYGTVTIEWGASEHADQYNVSITGVKIGDTTDTSYDWDTTTEPSDGDYIINITAYNATQHEENWANEITVKVDVPPVVDPEEIFVDEATTITVSKLKPKEVVNIEYYEAPYGPIEESKADLNGVAHFYDLTIDHNTTLIVRDDSTDGEDLPDDFVTVLGKTDLTVGVDKTEVVRGETTVIIVNVTRNGVPQEGVKIQIVDAAGEEVRYVTTGPNGEKKFDFFTDSAGIAKIYARLNVTGINTYTFQPGRKEGKPEHLGYANITVNPTPLNITITPSSVPAGFTKEDIKINITALGKVLSKEETEFKKDDITFWNKTTGDQVIVGGAYITGLTGPDAKGEFEFDVSSKTEVGTFTINVTFDWDKDGNDDYAGKGDLTLSKPADLNLITFLIDGAEITETNVSITKSAWQNGTKEVELRICGDCEDDKVKDAKITVTGAGLDLEFDNSIMIALGKYVFDISPKMAGTLTIDITNESIDYTLEKTITVRGAKIEVTTSKNDDKRITVDDTEDITIKLWDENDNPISNAKVAIAYYGGTENLWYLEGDGTLDKGKDGIYVNKSFKSGDPWKKLLVMADIGLDRYAYDVIEILPGHDLIAEESPIKALAGDLETTFTVNITLDNKSQNAEIYVMNETELDDFHEDSAKLTGKISSPTSAGTGNYTFKASKLASTQPGTYYVYVRTSDKKHDNFDNEPSFVLEKASVETSPTSLCKNVNTNDTVTFTVKWNDVLQNGTLRVIGVNPTGNLTYDDDSNAYIEIEIKDGKGEIKNVNATALGNITFKFEPKDGNLADAEGKLQIVPPTVSVDKNVIYLGEENTLTVTVTHDGTYLEGIKVRAKLPGRLLADLGTTDENGKIDAPIFPTGLGGYLTFEVAGEEISEPKVKIVIGLKIDAPSEVEEDTEITIKVLSRGGTAVEGATVTIGNWIGTTDDKGEVTYKPTEKGDYTITAEKDGYYPSEGVSTKLTVKEKPEVPGFEAVALIIGALVALLLVHRRRKRE